ncbi:hypothetical protein GCM10009133_09040 [Cocleimonas flava]|uniref:Uncharacterized protein n=1 Tax=Cocleimonas flava TaxID=634765 RepID=A0A4R1EZC7_9GAMM|nr:hypothetical protein [Cocleimonas flava]TCJ87266.1 hypothetical protein EV695_1774 [Cocleimonas flava]
MKKKCMVYKYSDENIGLIDYRMLPPKIVSPHDEPSMELIQRDVDEIKVSKNEELSFFTPSIVSIQLNVAKPALLRCGVLSKELKALAEKQKKSLETKEHEQLIKDSLVLYEYLECAQTAIMFSFTAIETFFNLSIPEDYEYKRTSKLKTEIFNKSQIERSISWKEKLTKIIPEIYNISDFSLEPFWGHLHQLIQIRNDIVHQKSSEDTEIVQKLIKLKVPIVCFSAIELIEHIYIKASENESIPECCERFPIVSADNIWLIKKTSYLKPVNDDLT